jgi:hypothetical protein
MARLPQKLSLDMMQTKWATELNPVISNTLVNGLLLSNITITTGANVINHLLGRKQIGWFITDINASAQIYRSQDLNNLTLTLTSDADCVASLWVF